MSTPTPHATIDFGVHYRLGCGRRSELGKVARRTGMRRPLVVTDPGVAELPWFAETLDTCLEAGLEVEVFDDIRSNPTLDNVELGLAQYRDSDRDGVILVGGGSVMDTGKAVALAATQPHPLFEYEFVLGPRYKEIDGAAVPPLVALPTTAGSGSEMSAGAVISDPAAGAKRTLLHPCLTPSAVIADPEVTYALPAHLTAGTGMDALTHALEAYVAPGYNPIADAVALEAMRLIGDHLPVACEQPSNPEARTQLMMAASMAAIAFQKGLGLVHAMAHPLGATADVHHGLANAVLLPYVLRYNRPAIEDRLVLLARHLGLAEPAYPSVLAWVLELRQKVGIPRRLAEVEGCSDPALPGELAPLAAAEKAYLMTNPRPVDQAEIHAIYTRAQQGELK